MGCDPGTGLKDTRGRKYLKKELNVPIHMKQDKSSLHTILMILDKQMKYFCQTK